MPPTICNSIRDAIMGGGKVTILALERGHGKIEKINKTNKVL